MINSKLLNIPDIATSKYWDSSSVRTTCINNRYYECGTNAEYSDMLQYVDNHEPTTEHVYAVAFDIVQHSDLLDRCSMFEALESVMYSLNNEAVRTVAAIADDSYFTD